MAPIQHFKTTFWPQKQPELTLPDFNAGFSALHQKLNQSKVENEEMITFFKDRIAIEEAYASRLMHQGKLNLKHSGFGRDGGAGLVKCFSQLKRTSLRVGEQHQTTAKTVSDHVLLPLQEFHDEYKQNISNSKQAIDSIFEVMPQFELDSLVRRMRQSIAVKDHRVAILGTYRNTSTGEDIAIWLQKNLPQCKDSPAMADVVGQQLIQPYNILRLIGQRGNKFIASASSFYQWQVKARREAEKSDQAYRAAVFKLDQLRMAIEEAMFAHLTEMEQVEFNRIEQLKHIISSFIASISVVIPQDKLVIEEMMVFQESLKPDQDIQFIVQQYMVSGFSPKAILYENYYHGISHDQVFGVPLEDLGKQSSDSVPKFISTILEAIDKGVDEIEDGDAKQKVWSTPCALDRVHTTCMELNTQSDYLTLDIMKKYESDLLVAVLRYFLLELPECLLTYECYDPVQALLGGPSNLRLVSFSNLVATLPASHFATLKSIFASITSFIQKACVSPDNILNISQSLGPVILRSRVDSYTVLSSKVPVKFVQELINHYGEIFSESTLKLHNDSEKRRLAKPIIAVQQQNQQEKSSKRGNKWTVNSMMGVFQRNNATNIEPQQTLLPRSVSLSFGSTITRQESPPSSPLMSPLPSVPESKKAESTVVFDGGDHIFDEREETAQGILKDIEEKARNTQQQPINSAREQIDSFFDDDDE
ncbi:hypothetical protein BD408DRAFT_350253 [Parasitella parasitica]|nr:hypothetical protein BD408DRAFT_350253 [Parasitella parasitica]